MSLLEYLAAHHIEFDAYPHAPAFSARRLARVLHRSGRDVVKAVLLFGPTGPCVALLAANAKLDAGRLSHLLGGPVRAATPDEAADVFRDCEWGVVSPFGNRYGLPVLLDDGLAGRRLVVGGQTHFDAVEMDADDLERLTGAVRCPLSRPGNRGGSRG